MKKRFIFGCLEKEKGKSGIIFGHLEKGKKGIEIYWSGKFFTKDKYFAREYATKPGTRRAIISLQKRGAIPHKEYFITGAQRG